VSWPLDDWDLIPYCIWMYFIISTSTWWSVHIVHGIDLVLFEINDSFLFIFTGSAASFCCSSFLWKFSPLGKLVWRAIYFFIYFCCHDLAHSLDVLRALWQMKTLFLSTTAMCIWYIFIDRVAGAIIHLIASIRPFVGALLFEPFDFWPWFLASGSTLTLASLGL